MHVCEQGARRMSAREKAIALRLLRLVQLPFGFVFWWIEQILARWQDKRALKEWRNKNARQR
jgi:hypothetical protein